MRNTFLPALIIFMIGLYSAPAVAQSDNLAQGHYLAGQAYYKQARYQDAIREFEEAYRLSPKPALLFNLAQAYERLGQLDKTVEYLKLYLTQPDVKDRRATEERLKNLEARIQATGIKLICAIDGAQVTIDGKPAGQLPLKDPVPVKPGSHEIRVEKAGYEPYSAFVSATHGTVVDINVKLVKEKSTTPEVMPGGANQETAEAAPRSKQLWTWIAAGTAGALLITWGITGGLALSKAGKANEPGNDYEALSNSSKTLALVSDITLGLGIAAAAGATILYFMNRDAESAKTVLAPYLGHQAAGVSAGFKF